MARGTIVVTDQDMNALTLLLDGGEALGRDLEHAAALAAELERAQVVPSHEIPPGVVTMGSRVRVLDLDSGEETVYTLAYSSRHAPPGENRLSVLAPIGTALLGYEEGDEVEWRAPGGVRRLHILQVVSQPEATRRRRSRPGTELGAVP